MTTAPAYYSDKVNGPVSGRKMRCDTCGTKLGVEQFAVSVANGWGKQHVFQRPEVNQGNATTCTGHWALEAADAARGKTS